jgi:hypothetical protein
MKSGMIFTNRAEVDSQLKWLLKQHGVDMQFAGRDLMRIAANNLVKFTFPRSPKDGKNAVVKQISGLIRELPKNFKASKNDGGTLLVFGEGDEKKKRIRFGIEASSVAQGLSDLEAYHNANRNARGQVPRSASKFPGSRKTLAGGQNVMVMGGMYAKPSLRKQFINLKKKHVGRAKSGWAPGAEYFAGLTGGRSGVPAFASTTKHGINGTWMDTFTAAGNGFGVIANTVPYVSHPGSGAVQIAMKVTRTYLEKVTKKQVEKIAQRFNSLGSGRAAA